jgi:hypothetical protein
MLAVVAVALLKGRGTAVAGVLATALFMVVLLDPCAIQSAGFWLSFGAVALILYVGTGRVQRPRWLVEWARVQWAITLGLVPLLLVLFQQVSLVSPLANAVAIPVVSLGVVPLTLVGLLLPVDALLIVAAKLMDLCYRLLELLSGLPEAVWRKVSADDAAGRPAGGLMLAPLVPGAGLGFAAAISVQAARPAPILLARCWMWARLAAVVRTAAIRFHAGPPFQPRAAAASSRRPARRGCPVDGLIVSHDDGQRRHASGCRRCRLAGSRPRFGSLPSPPRRLCFAGSRNGRRRFEMLHLPDSHNAQATDNDRSCVLRVVASSGSALLTADIERGAEAQVLERAAARLAADVLLVPHHGSATSSSDGFLDQSRPRIAIVPVGYRNRFGHPVAEVLARSPDGATVYRTDRDGRCSWRIGREISARAWRTHPRYWQERWSGDLPGARSGRRRRARRVARRDRQRAVCRRARAGRSGLALASESYGARRCRDGEPLLGHCREVATLLCELHREGESLAAALLNAMPEAATGWSELVSERVGAPVAALIEGVARMAQIQGMRAKVEGGSRPAERAGQLEALRKMLLAMVQDARVVLLKLADQTQTLRYLAGRGEPAARPQRATPDLFAPLANRRASGS